MNSKTKENLAIAFIAGITTFAITFAIAHYINPTIRRIFNKR